MLFNQIVREQVVPLSLSLNNKMTLSEELRFAQRERSFGYVGRTANDVAIDMEKIIAEAVDDAIIDCRQENSSLF